MLWKSMLVYILEAIVGSIEKAQDVVDLTERRVCRGLDKIGEKEDNFNALFGLGKYKDASMKDRVTAVFAVKDTVKKTCAEYGDILGVNRGLYQHYAIYIGNNRVIHYAGADKEVSFNATIREGLGNLLGKISDTYIVCGKASDGEEWLILAKELKPDLIFTDIEMPKLNGLEMIKKIKEDGQDPYFVILSGYSDFKYAQKGITLGVEEYLLKPIT